jgi:N-glycosylase/DNA lyase
MTLTEAEPSQVLFEEDDKETVHAPLRLLEILKDYQPEVLPSTGEMLDVTVDKEHAFGILDAMMQAFDASEFPYYLDNVRVPQDPRHMPENLVRDSIAHGKFWVRSCAYMRGGIRSTQAVIRMSRVFEDHPKMFDSIGIFEYGPDEIARILKEHGLGYQVRTANEWIENDRRLLERYDSDPRRIFEGVNTYDQSLMRIQNDDKGGGLVGFQEKMTSMLLYYLMDEGLIEEFNFPIPIDLHVMRVSIANEMLKFPNAKQGTNLFVPETLSALRKLYYDYAEDRGISALRLCDAVWLLSESLCGQHPGNKTIEPLGRKNREGRTTVLIPNRVIVGDPKQQQAYENSCRKCPIQDTCEFNIPGTIYYVGGYIVIRGRRVRFPIPAEQMTLI